MTDDWDTRPRMLHEPCEGPHGGFSTEVYALDLPNGVRLWLCKSCWIVTYRTQTRSANDQPA